MENENKAVAVAKQVIASQTKVAAAALKQMKAAEADGNMEAAVVAAEKLRAAVRTAENVNGAEEAYGAMMEGIGCTVGERSGIKFYSLPFSEAVSEACRARRKK